MKIIKKGGFKTLAGPSNSTATEIPYVYDQLALEIGQAKGVVRSSKGKINVAKLRSTFRGGTLDKWADQDDWETIINEYQPKPGRSAQPKSIAVAIIAGTTRLQPQTVESYVKPSRRR